MKDECQVLIQDVVDFAQKTGQRWPESLKQRVRTHLDECSRCRAELLVEAALADARSAAGLDLPVDDERVLARICDTLRKRTTWE